MFIMLLIFLMVLVCLWVLFCYLFVPKFSERIDKLMSVLEEDIPHKKIIVHQEDDKEKE